MAMEHANSFVERLFENDEFLKTIIKKRGYTKSENTNEDIETEKLIGIANDMGFKFDADEFKEACKTYMSELDGWEATQKIFHVFRIVAKNYKENNK